MNIIIVVLMCIVCYVWGFFSCVDYTEDKKTRRKK
jgi:hypothetical protein